MKEEPELTREWIIGNYSEQYHRRLRAAVEAPYLLTQLEYNDTVEKPGTRPYLHITQKNIKYHKRSIKKALSKGKLVPAEVLEDYPDLKLVKR